MKKYKYYIITLFLLITTLTTICFIPIGISRFIPIVEEQVEKELGVKVHINKLIMRLGPNLKIKAPIMHIMYNDGQKFAQFDNVRFLIPYSSLLKKDKQINKIYANKFILKIDSEDNRFNDLLTKLQNQKIEHFPKISLKKYSIDCYDNILQKQYKLVGSNFETSKVKNFKSIKINSLGEFFIGNKKYLTYDIAINPEINFNIKTEKKDIREFLDQIELYDFHSDIIADIKFYQNKNNITQISGLLNIDNISVLDYAKKCPKSFAYLTFLGDKASIKSNIFATQDKKVYIEGIVNNSKKPSLELKVKTDEINMNDLYKKIKLIVNCSRLKDIQNVTGKLVADFTIKGDLNKIKSTGFVKLSDATLNTNGVNINNINADIDLSNNIINIINAVGQVNNSPIIAKGNINNQKLDLELAMNKVGLKNLIPATYGIESGTASLVANITGTFDKIIHTENIQVDNFRMNKNNIGLSFANLKYDSNKNDSLYINNIQINTKNLETIKIPELKTNIQDGIIKLKKTNIFLPNSKFECVADVTNYLSKDLNFNLKLDGTLSSKDIKTLKESTLIFPIKFRANGNKLTQNINAQLVFENASVLNEPSIINFVSKINNNNVKIEELALHTFYGKFSDDLKLNLKGNKKAIITGNIEGLKNPKFKNLRIFVPSNLNITLFDTIAQLKGDIFLNGELKSPEIIGQLSIQNIINQYIQLGINNLLVDFNKNIAQLNAPQVKIGDSAFAFNSIISTNFTEKLNIKNLNIKSKYINTDTILMYKDLPQFTLIPLIIENGKLYSERVHSTLYGNTLNFTSLNSDLKLKNNILSLENLNAELYNGQIAGNIDFNLRDEHYNAKLQARKISASPIFNLITTKKETISGILDFDSNLSGQITTKESLDGNIKFEVTNGRMSTLGKLEHLLYAQNVIADNMLRTSLSVVTKAITLKDTGLFKKLRGDIDLKEGIANINFLQSQGPLMSLFIKGKYNISSDYAQLVVLGRISDEIISGLGAFGDFSWNKLMIMLTGEEEVSYVHPEDFEKLPQLTARNTKEFRSVINGIIDKPSSVILFNWISHSKKSYRQKEYTESNEEIPEFIENLPY